MTTMILMTTRIHYKILRISMDSYGFLEVLPQGCSNLTNLATQKRPNTEPQGVPEALETLIR